MTIDTNFQQSIALDTLYQIGRSANNSVGGQLQPNIEVVGGTVDIYGSQEEAGSPPTDMYKTRTAFVGIEAFGVLPRYLYVTQNSGTTTSIILSGVQATEVA